MTATDTPWEPPIAGSEVEHLLGMLERLRATFRWKTDGLDAAGLWQRLGTSSLTLGGLLKHLAFVEDYTFTVKLRLQAPGEPWQSADWDADPDWEFTSAATDSPEQLYAIWDAAVERSRARLRAAIAEGGLGGLAELHDENGEHVSVRRLVCDLIEEYGRYTGYADLLRESVDGLVGEDPPDGWRPSAAPSG